MTSIKIKHLSKSYSISPFSIKQFQGSLREDVSTYFRIPSMLFTEYFLKIKTKLMQRSIQQNSSSFFFIVKKISRKYILKLVKKMQRKIKTKETYWALKDISVSFTAGDIVGIIGKNGSGKSTFLKVIAGITPPTNGEIHIQGDITTLLGIGIGFHTDLTGKENIFLSGALLGFKKKELEKEFNNIVSFSGVEKFINTPVKFYSSGMYARLAFSIATSSCNTADILLIDEVFAVGDEAFKQKSLNRIKQLAENKKKIILLVSHERSFIENLCNKCLWLENGKIKAYGEPKLILDGYTTTTKV